MPIPFRCPHCGHTTQVLDEFAGQSGPCSGCGQTVTIPQPASGAYEPTVGAYEAPVQRSRGSSTAIIIVAVVVVVVVVCGGLLTALLLPAVQKVRESARRAQCMNNLHQISLAMHSYNAEYGCFPPAYIPDENGRPMHSWRVLLLPYLGENMLYDQYDFDEPWNGPNNCLLIDRMPDVYRCQSEVAADSSEPSYVMIVGPGTISDGPSSTRDAQITDGKTQTIMFVETCDAGFDWLQPQDLDAQQISYRINDGSGEGIRSNHRGGVHVGSCDGSVRFLSDQTDPNEIRGMTTISGGEPVDVYSGDY
ncbi:MAG: DUF1559 domain-containing protein [Candidatus Nealsonbacteria bacterium]|nr:DUF1559 domain-containing protein [Candidatus Nealsonbacteria bacterium]